MKRLPTLLAPCLFLAVIAAATAWLWLTLTRAQILSPGAVIVCAGISVAIALVAESAVRRIRHGRTHRAHAEERGAA
jgi:uncharacterized protein YybS (DUF2232 family)